MAYVKNWLDQGESGMTSLTDKYVDPYLEDITDVTGAVQSELMDVSNFLNRFNRNLPRYANSQASVRNWEPVFLNQFDVIITPPAAISGTGYFVDLLVEQVKDVKGLPEIVPTRTVEQQYMWAKRTFSKPVPEETTAELQISFEVNLNHRNSMYVYEMLRAWADLGFDQSTGMHGMKRQYSGEITVLIHNKIRRVFRQFNFKPVYMINSLTQMELAYLSDDIYVVSAVFKADAWKEKRNTLPINA